MKPCLFKPVSCLKGDIDLPGDKSIAHRSIILSCLSEGKTRILNFPVNEDCTATIKIFEELGVSIKKDLRHNILTVEGAGLYGLRQPGKPLYSYESGTTFRLLMGVLAGQNFKTVLTAARSLSKRPMLRVIAPLRLMGAEIRSRSKNINSRTEEYPPVAIKGGELNHVTYRLPVASAQVKSAVLLAGLYAKGLTLVVEKEKTRDHTERMLKLFKARLKLKAGNILIEGGHALRSPGEVNIPGDISSAAFFIVASLIVPGSRVVVKNVGLNPTRTGIIRVLRRMGADIKVKGSRQQAAGSEPIGDLVVKSSGLKGTIIRKNEIPSLIDELPVLMVAASLAKGTTKIIAAEELRVKETDRINSMCSNLAKMGANIKVNKSLRSEAVIIKGVKQLTGAKVKSFNDHRTAMSMIVASLVAHGVTLIDDVRCIKKSFPQFIAILDSIIS